MSHKHEYSNIPAQGILLGGGKPWLPCSLNFLLSAKRMHFRGYTDGPDTANSNQPTVRRNMVAHSHRIVES